MLNKCKCQKTRKKARSRHERGERQPGGEAAAQKGGVKQNETGKSPKLGLNTSAILSLFPLLYSIPVSIP